MKYSELHRLLRKKGWKKIRQRGSHVILENPEFEDRIILPDHGSKEVKNGLLNGILKQAKLK